MSLRHSFFHSRTGKIVAAALVAATLGTAGAGITTAANAQDQYKYDQRDGHWLKYDRRDGHWVPADRPPSYREYYAPGRSYYAPPRYRAYPGYSYYNYGGDYNHWHSGR